MIDHIEAALALRPVDRGDVDDAPELAALVIAQEFHDLDDVGSNSCHGELSVGDVMSLHGTRQGVADDPAECVEAIIHQAKSVSAR
jgi:hypothetical protein